MQVAESLQPPIVQVGFTQTPRLSKKPTHLEAHPTGLVLDVQASEGQGELGQTHDPESRQTGTLGEAHIGRKVLGHFSTGGGQVHRHLELRSQKGFTTVFADVVGQRIRALSASVQLSLEQVGVEPVGHCQLHLVEVEQVATALLVQVIVFVLSVQVVHSSGTQVGKHRPSQSHLEITLSPV